MMSYKGAKLMYETDPSLPPDESFFDFTINYAQPTKLSFDGPGWEEKVPSPFVQGMKIHCGNSYMGRIEIALNHGSKGGEDNYLEMVSTNEEKNFSKEFSGIRWTGNVINPTNSLYIYGAGDKTVSLIILSEKENIDNVKNNFKELGFSYPNVFAETTNYKEAIKKIDQYYPYESYVTYPIMVDFVIASKEIYSYVDDKVNASALTAGFYKIMSLLPIFAVGFSFDISFFNL